MYFWALTTWNTMCFTGSTVLRLSIFPSNHVLTRHCRNGKSGIPKTFHAWLLPYTALLSMLQITMYLFLPVHSQETAVDQSGASEYHLSATLLYRLSPMFPITSCCTFFYNIYEAEPLLEPLFRLVWELGCLYEGSLFAACACDLAMWRDYTLLGFYVTRICVFGTLSLLAGCPIPLEVDSGSGNSDLRGTSANRKSSLEVSIESAEDKGKSRIIDTSRILQSSLCVRDRDTQVLLMVLLLSMVILRALALMSPYLFEAIWEGFNTALETNTIPTAAITISGVCSALGIVATQAFLWARCRIKSLARNRLTNVLYTHAMGLSKAYHDSQPASETNEKMHKVENISQLPEQLFQLTDELFDLCLAAAYMTYFDTRLPYLILTIVLAHIHFDRVGDANNEPLQEKKDDKSRILNGEVFNNLTNRDLVINHGNLDRTASQIYESVKDYSSADVDHLDQYYKTNMILNHIMNLGEHIWYFVLAFQCARGHWSPWRTYNSHTHWQTIRTSAFSLRAQAAELQARLIDARHITELLDVKSSVPEKPDAEVLGVGQGKIILTNVSFRYQAKKLSTEKTSGVDTSLGKEAGVQNLTIKVEFGKVLALVGPSGSGKSTVLNLIARQYDVDEGSIVIGTQDVRDVTKQSLSSCVGLLSQKTCILPSLGIKENVAYGRPSATNDEISKACKAAMIHDFITELPQGYDTVLNNEVLSGGQCQRIALARVILEKSDILLLDEPTSALDPETEAEVFRNILALRGLRTIVFVTHNLRHAMKADCIMVLSEGRLVEQGTHAELQRATEGKYSHMWRSQNGTIAPSPVETSHY